MLTQDSKFGATVHTSAMCQWARQQGLQAVPFCSKLSPHFPILRGSPQDFLLCLRSFQNLHFRTQLHLEILQVFRHAFSGETSCLRGGWTPDYRWDTRKVAHPYEWKRASWVARRSGTLVRTCRTCAAGRWSEQRCAASGGRGSWSSFHTSRRCKAVHPCEYAGADGGLPSCGSPGRSACTSGTSCRSASWRVPGDPPGVGSAGRTSDTRMAARSCASACAAGGSCPWIVSCRSRIRMVSHQYGYACASSDSSDDWIFYYRRSMHVAPTPQSAPTHLPTLRPHSYLLDAPSGSRAVWTFCHMWGRCGRGSRCACVGASSGNIPGQSFGCTAHRQSPFSIRASGGVSSAASSP